MKLINNQEVRLFDELKSFLTNNSEVYLCCSYFTIPALFELSDQLRQVQSIRILIDSKADQDIRFAYDQNEWLSYLDLRSKHKSDTSIEIIRSKSQIRHGNVGGQKFILVKNGEQIHCFSIVPQDLNLVTLGISPAPGPIILSYFEDTTGQFLNLFNQFWNNSHKDLKQLILSVMEKASADNAPELIYKFSLFNLFQNATIDEVSEQRLKKIGFKETNVWKMLYNFQQDAVLGAIDKIETFGGCIIADSVGLGKTFEALAVMKYYQMRNDRILVLCPKKLRDNWVVYAQNDVRNILSKDRLNFDVLNHTDLSRKNGMSGYINLETINWGNYDLIVIDESHNFRNNPPVREGITRYQRLMTDIIKTGVKTKVLMLSATPVNTKMNDIKNQISFITEQNDKALEPYGINSIEVTLRRAQQRFNNWLKNNYGHANSRDTLVDSLDGAYFKILDLLTIARSRKHIQKYYDVRDIGKFPDRLKPISRHADFDVNRSFPAMDKVNNDLNALNLKFYSPLSYVRGDKRPYYEAKYDITTANGSIFKQIERESSLIHLMRVNLLKRLESSIHAFRLTLESLLKHIDSILLKIENAHSNASFDSDLDINEVDLDDELLEDLLVGGKIKVLLQDIDLIKCREELLDDKKRIRNLLAQTVVIDAERDAKLLELKKLILDKITFPINPGNKKIIIFSAFADTVKYLYEHLQPWLKSELGLYTAQVTGGETNKTNLPDCRPDLTSILTNFSPISKKREIIMPNAVEEIDILFCTDCISEGQNLQDCDYLINYDIHWNPVRIIQRFGRIDRIGSRNDKIQLVNFFPNLDLDSYIDLIGRVQGRMQILDVSATGDDNIIDETVGHKQDLEYRKRQLVQLQNKVLDLEDIEGGISITDLTFNDFKIDADRLTTEEREAYTLMPKGIYAVTQSNLEDAPKGVIFCLKDLSAMGEDVYRNNAIFPYSLCYVNADGEIFIPGNNPKRCLDYFKKLCLGKQEILPALVAEFNKETRTGKNMDAYVALLQTTLRHLKGVDEDMGLDSLATPGGTRLFKTEMDGTYELVSFLVIK
ncbi:DEAD/DEAH box helicase family protein [Adhaeribacter sp. BT258]|uniref:DEAD/DEAH box helicase family protein n=1 Tax=Adhaeribacter terrigena TaxID=2793070 RepID=A0ABS1BXF0_9BACT|nr:helicase-related protein [Adhaeribacter terrigena]MBK0401806.1 DEAD/DEAH box helicase family protein [Adhaeribacter terrigena]